MTTLPLRLALALGVIAFAARAHAVTNDCSTAGDGTPCGGPCISSGVCAGHVCQPKVTLPDGTLCSSGNRCTTGDSCMDGVCQPSGEWVACPGMPPCLVGVCDPQVGCKTANICDLNMPADLGGAPDSSVPADLSGATDLGRAGDLVAPSELGTDAAEGTADLAGTLPDAGLAPADQVRGSSFVGGCSAGARAPSSPPALVLLLAAVLALRGRRT